MPTTTSVWLNTTNSYLQTHAQYDQFGNVRKAWDALGNESQVEYSSTYSYAYPTTSTTAVPDSTGVHGLSTALTASATYNANTGLMTSTTDANGQTTSYSYDSINRPSTITRPTGGGSTTYTYGDTPGSLYVRTQTSIDSARVIEAYKYFDGLGRACRSFLNEGSTYSTTDTQYDSMGRVWRASNPYRTTSLTATVNPSGDWTTNSYDYLGRVLTVTTPDSAVVTSAYSGSTSSPVGSVVTVTDQAGKARKSVTDALGRLTTVYEDPSSLNYQTSYTYDTLDNLTGVTQDSQTRTFVYNSLKRLTSATNPESGTISYQYDANGNLTQKTDARSVTTTYAYDALNRATSRTYSDSTPTVSYVYDAGTGVTNAKGRLVSVSSSVSSYSYASYDAMGRAEGATQTIGSQSYSVGYAYDLAGHVTSMTYPSGRTVTYNYDVAGRMADKDSTHLAFTGDLGDGVTRTYATISATDGYDPAGRLLQEQFGTATPVYNKLAYNSRGQLSEIRASTAGSDTSWNRGKIVNDYSSQCSGASCNGTDNNGNLLKQSVYVPNNDANTSSTSWYQQYAYDSLNRLTQVHEITGNTSLDSQQSYLYDRWGNRRIDTNSSNTFGTGINNMAFDVDSANNRLKVPTGQSGTMTYDAAGNLTTDTYSAAAVSRAYDAENRMTSETQAASAVVGTYGYDGDGHRVNRVVNGTETWQVYGIGGELLAEYPADTAAAAPTKEYGYRNGQLLITAEPQRTNFALATNGAVATAQNYTIEGTYTNLHFQPTYAIDGSHVISSANGDHYWRDELKPDWITFLPDITHLRKDGLQALTRFLCLGIEDSILKKLTSTLIAETTPL